MSSPSSENSDKFHVLVVDDEQQICDLVNIFLMQTEKFATVISANSAATAMQKMQNQYFDLVIVDFAMPNKSGIEFIINIKQILKFNHIRFLLISGCLQKTDVLSAMNFGVKNILVKPFTRSQLVEKVFKLLNIPC